MKKMASSGQENVQWLSVTEETLFLHDGLIRVTDLVELPKDVNNSSEGDSEVITFDLKNPTELSQRLLSVCGTHNNAYSKLLEYRLNALRGLWNAQKQIAVEEENERESNNTEETIAILKKQGLWKEPEQASFSTRISVLLVLPLLQSQSRIDPHLCGVASGVLLGCLHDCAPLSLSKEPGDCLKGLENLLCSWLGEKNSKEQCEPVENQNQRKTIASALVALACARGHLKTFIHTVHLLQKLPDLQALPVGEILTKLLETEGGQGHVPAILGSKHVLCWGFEDLLSGTEKESGEKDKADGDIGRSLACDGVFLYTTNACGRGLAKIGSGLHGSIRGYVYARNPDIGPGKVAYGDSQILYRPLSYDQEGETQNFFQLLDKQSLQPVKTIPKPEEYTEPGICTTIAFCSDGVYFYWIWCPALVSDKNAKGMPVYMEMFAFKVEDNTVAPVQPRITLTKKDEASSKALNDSLLSRLRPSYRGSFNTLAQIVGADNGTAKKEEGQAAGSTSCGVLLKVLVKTPVFVDGSHVVLLTPLPGGSASNAARSLFGSSGGLASLRTLATNFCFTIKDGQFAQRPDLADAPNCSLARGAPLASLGTCFDVENNVMWCCSSDWVDQFCNPGHQAPHHVKARLGISQSSLAGSSDNLVPVSDVVKQLLQHVGGMCLHLIQSDRLYTPLGSYMLQQYPVDYVHLERIWDILHNSFEVGNSQTIICALIVLQLIFKESVVKTEQSTEQALLQRTRELVWQILVYEDSEEKRLTDLGTIQKEACVVIANGLTVLYPTTEDKHTLMMQLLNNGRHSGLGCLRDMLLVEFADQLKCNAIKIEQYNYLRLTDDIIQLLLKIAVKESCCLLEESLSPDKEQFEHLLSRIPVASPCQQYLIALQSHVLREAVLFNIPEENQADIDEAKRKLKELQTYIQGLATKIFQGSCQVLEMLLETCNKMITVFKDDLENRFQGLEKVTKATILGHLMPTLLTSLIHQNLSCLSIADVIMPQLVQLVVLSSQAALLLKSQVQAILNDDSDMDSDSDVIEVIGQSVTPEKVDMHDQEEQGFLAGLKIPAPWASGKTVESIHPVRDNYKFKETVHIPGARCLYLRFDTRSSSQYDYDKMVIHAGANTTSKKVAEYGGNTFGFGSRSVLGSGWPKDLVRVEGDTVTFSFEMRSGREHNTPDKAMWGFHVTVRAQESPEEVSIGLPFLADLGLGLSVLSCTMLHLLYQGQEKTREEESCQHLLKSKLLQRCVWQSGAPATLVTVKDVPLYEEGQTMSPKSPKIPRIRLPTEIMRNLLTLSQGHQPYMRPSVREAIQYDVMEECLVSAVVKHLGLQETVRYFTPSKEQQTDDFMLLSSVMEEVCRRFDALIRQLQFLADLEQRWYREVQDFKQDPKAENPPFFHDYHLQETKLKELSMLCFVKDVHVDPNKLDDTAKELREKFVMEVQSNDTVSKPAMPRTKQLVEGILTRLDLLLHVNISPADYVGLTRTVSQSMEANKCGPNINVMVRSDTDVLGHSSLLRSISAPSGVDIFQDDTALDLIKLHRRRPGQKLGPTSVLQGLVEDNEEKGKPPHVILIGQLFSFIGSEPQKAISCEAFLKTAHLRWWRGNTRKQALIHMKELLSAASRVGGATHLVAAVTSVLRHGPRIEELTCGGMVNQVREAFAETMTSVVQLAARYPIACCNSIGLLCIVPYTRAEEKCLVRSGLVHLLDKLCSLANHRGDMNMEKQSMRQKVSAMAWAGFQVLADRCVMWETEEGSQFEELEHSGLARQVSVLLTNHLARATESGGNEAAGTEALQEVLSLLNNLSRSNMGKAILSQPACVSKLLSLMLDQRPSPKLVLIILQLCRVALPLMDAVDCEQVVLPNWSHMGSAHWSTTQPISDPPARIVSLLLARLGDFLVPGDLATVASRQQSIDTDINRSAIEKDKSEDLDIQNGRLSVFVHKRDDQFSHEVIQPLLSSESRPFRLGGGSNMEKVVRLDREMTKTGKAEIATEDAMVALRKAAKWSQMGFIVSTGPPVDSVQAEVQTGDKKKADKDVICREKNAELARTDPVRQFISGHVANSMAAEVIELLHSLMNAPVSNTARSWAEAVQRVLVNALSSMPVLLNSLGSLNSPRCHSQQLMSMGRQVNAALCALGGFKEMVKPGCHVTVIGDEVQNTTGTVISVSQVSGLVKVKLEPEVKGEYSPRYSDTIEVPSTRVQPSRNQMFSSPQLSMTDAIVTAIQSILLPQDENLSPLQVPLPVTDDGSSLGNQICRVVAELETRACIVLALYLQDIEFTREFIQHCGSSIDMLKSLAKDCSTGERQSVVQSHCERLRLLYRDCAKPPPPPSKVDNRNKEIIWNTSRDFPPVRACLFSNGLTGITFLGDPSAGTGLPRGTMVYANMPIPFQAPSFYWELEACSFGDSQEETSAFVSLGFAPPAEKKDGAWTNPVGTCLFLNNGKAVHYNGASLLQWRSVRLDVSIGAGDIAGVGWERTGDAPAQGETPKGKVYFTYNGRRLGAYIDDVSGAMYPVVHIQKKNTRVKANFGARPFAFAEGQQHREAADEANDLTREIRESFSHLPFNSTSDSEGEGTVSAPSAPSSVVDPMEVAEPLGPPCKTVPVPKPLKEYNPENCKHYKLFKSYDSMVTLGPDQKFSVPTQDSLSDEESMEEDQSHEDHYALLVKAWEQKVFPTIRRRFRNEAERKDGLEQIRGALQLGMTDIARQTVEFLYEENGGMPRDLHLPTIEDIKEDLAKFTIDRVRKGTTVVIRDPKGTGSGATTVLPKYAVRSMLKTFGLTGTVLDIDNPNELVQLETYLRSEGVLVRYWYPLAMIIVYSYFMPVCSIVKLLPLGTVDDLMHYCTRPLASCNSASGHPRHLEPNELVQVETYLRSEGVLVRYWYPLAMLERPPQGLRKSTITGGQILETSNVNIHRELIRSERTLARMFCRKALLKLIDHCNSSAMEVISCSATLTSGMAASAAVLQELDIENIQLLSNELLRAPQSHGTITAKSLTMTDSSQHCLAAHSCSLSNLLYKNVDRLKKELAIAIARAARQGEDYLIELTNQICICLQTAPEMFPFEEYPVTETKTTTDVHFPGAACLIVTCKTDPKATKKETSLYKSPWARVYCYTGQRIKKTGQISKQEVVSYPRDTSSTSNQVEQYTPAIIPCDRIHLRVGVSPPPGIIVTIHALPPQFLLALTYIETLITEQHGCGTKSCAPPKQEEADFWEQAFARSERVEERVEKSPQESLWNLDNIIITPLVFSHMIEQFCGYMWRTDMPALVKEYLFHLLAQSIRVLHYSEGSNGTKLPTPQPHLNPAQGLLIQLHNELQVLYEAESKGWVSATTSCGSGIGLGVTDRGRFSTYFHALMEANLAVAEIAKPSTKPKAPESSLTLDIVPKPPSSPTHTSRRKKIKTKRKEGSSHRRSEGPPRTSESEGDSLPQPVLTGLVASSASPSPSASSTSNQSTAYATASSGASSSVSLLTPSSVSSTSLTTASATSSSTSQDSKDAAPVKSKQAKHEENLWFHRALTVSHILRCLAFDEKNGTFFLVNAISEANQALNTITAHQRLVIITGIPNQLQPDFVFKSLRSVLKAHGGADRDSIFLPYDTLDIPVHQEAVRDAATGELIPTKSGKEEHLVDKGDTKVSDPSKEETADSNKQIITRTRLKGYAVIPVLSKTKVEGLKKSLLKNRTLFEGNSVDQNDPSEMPTISTVAQNLIAEENANEALEHFLRHKLFQDDRGIELSDAATLALTEIFHSCFIIEQRHGQMEFRQESGYMYICLGKDQILQHTPENLLCTFFNSMRQPKKSVTEQVMQTLRRYGTLRTPDKESSPSGEKHGKGKGKKPQRSAKEKVVMVVEKPGAKDKKPKEKAEHKGEKEASAAESAEKAAKAPVQKEEDHCLTLDGFLQFVLDHIRQDVRPIWRALLSCGFDIHFQRCACLDTSQAQQMARQWTPEMDTALTQYVNSYSRKLAVAPARLHPHEIYISQEELTNEKYVCLQGIPLESIRLRFAFLQSLNNSLESFFLPLIDLRPADTYSRSTAALLSTVRGLLFYDTKSNLTNRVLNATAQRKPDQAAPEITLDPLEVIGEDKDSAIASMYCQAYRQLSAIPSSQFCVRLACGGDPTYSFNVKFTGEEVHGTSGSFRHFLWQIARELQGPLLNILVPSSSGSFRGRCILQPGPLTLSEERLIMFLGQLLGITIRADIPMGLDLSPSFWKTLVGLDLDPVIDIKEADPLTYSYMKKIEVIESESELYALCADVYPTFMYPSLSGEEVELIPGGRNISVCWENRHQYVEAIRRLRLLELKNESRLQALRAGLASIVPLHLMTIMSPFDMELRTCGLPKVDIEFLKAHTMYQVGLMESDTHIEYFWTTLEGLSQEDLSKFIKFACNQERIPMTCPCKDGATDTTHVPPYPMKIAPPDGQESPDTRYIRVETCMFMIKLPQYSSQEIMTQRLMYAIHCREDPLSG